MSKKYLIIGGMVIATLSIIFFVVNMTPDPSVVVSTEKKICYLEGKNEIILEAIAKKYPESQIDEASESFSMASGPHWELKIKTKDNKIATESLICSDFFSLEQCDKEVKEEGKCVGICDGKQLDRCYSEVASFYEDFNICKKIGDNYIRNNCFAIFAGLSPDEWSPSICKTLTDIEVRTGCIDFFKEDLNN